MSDVFDSEKRSEVMRKVRSKGNKSTELKLIALFRENGITGWRRNYRVKGHPDFVFLDKRIAISHSRDPKRSDKNNIKINSAFEQITGRTKEELIDSGWAKISYRRYEKLYCQQGGINREN